MQWWGTHSGLEVFLSIDALAYPRGFVVDQLAGAVLVARGLGQGVPGGDGELAGQAVASIGADVDIVA